MKKIILYLSGKWDPSISDTFGKDDILLCAPGKRPPDDFTHWTEIPKVPHGHEKEVCDWLVKSFSETVAEPGFDKVQCLLNDYYSYCIRPLVALFLKLKEVLDETEIVEVFILTAKSTNQQMPMFGFQNSESLRGSPNLQYAYAANMLPQIFPKVHFRYKYLKGDPLCNDILRRTFVSGANFVFMFLFVAKALWGGLRNTANAPKFRPENVVLLRTEHQLRFARRLCECSSQTAFVVFPQASQGSFKTISKLYVGMPKNGLSCRISVTMLIRAAKKLRSNICELKHYARQIQSKTMRISGLEIPISFGSIADEIRLVSVILFYKNLLSEFLKKNQPSNLITFELVGRMAGLESLASRENDVRIFSIQTALISAVPHPIFPYSDKFYSDSATTAIMIAQNGSQRFGAVVYEGPLYPVNIVRKKEVLKTISFFTQPYEHNVTLNIISALCRWAENNQTQVMLRLHPRDTIAHYKQVLSERKSVLQLAMHMGLSELVEASDLCITRTSSVAKEAIAMGATVLLCPWSHFDQSVKADYIVRDSELNYCAEDESSLVNLLNHTHALVRNTEILQKKMFDGKTTNTLCNSLFGNV